MRGRKFPDRGDVGASFCTLAVKASALLRRRSTLTSSRSAGSALPTDLAPAIG
jgi:hypothetical protein